MASPVYYDRLRDLATSDAQFQQLAALVDDIIIEETRHLRKERDQALFKLDESSVVMVALDRDGRMTYVNKKLCALLGYSCDDLIGQNWFHIALPPEDSDRVYRQFLRVMSGDNPAATQFENEVVSRHGKRYLISWHNTYDRDVETGEILGALSSGQDITVQRVMEDTLHQNELRYRQMFYANNAIKLVIERQTGDIVEANEAACDFYGYSYEQLIRMNLGQINVLSYEELVAAVGRDVQGQMKFQHRTASGEVKDVEIYSSLMTYDDDELRFSVIIDVTERERAKKLLEMRELQFRTIVDNFPGVIILFDEQLQAIAVRGEIQHPDIQSVSDLEGGYLPDVLPPDIWKITGAQFSDALTGNVPRRKVQYQNRHYVEQIKPMVDHHHNIIGGLYLLQDVTEMHETDQLLHETQQQLRTILDGVVDGVGIVSPDETLLYANEAAAHILGFPAVDVMMQTMQQNLKIERIPLDENGEFLPFEQQAVHAALTGETPPPQIVAFHDPENDHTIWTETKAKPIFNTDRDVRFAVVIITDITRAREMETLKLRALREQAQIETLRTYIASTTHDIAQPLSVINTAIYMLDRIVQDEKVQRRTKSIQAQTMRIQSILEDIQQISLLDTITSLEFMTVNLEEIIKTVTGLFKGQGVAKNITFNIYLRDLTASVHGNPPYIQQALKQVVTNAMDYTGEGGTITLTTYYEQPNFIIQLEDTGIGIPAEVIERITERFYRVDESRTSSPRSGSGLGLSITRRIMQLHGGELQIESVEGTGTTVQLIFPAKMAT